MANTSKYFVTSSPGANFLDFDLHYGSLSLTGEDVGFFGSSKVDMVFARPGVTVDFTTSGSSADKVYLTGAYDDYTRTISGTNITLSRLVNGLTESVTFAPAANYSGSDKIVFADGTVSSWDIFNHGSTSSPTSAHPTPNGETSVNPNIPASLSATIKAFSLNQVDGDTFALVKPGAKLILSGGNGVDVVYVKPGSTVDAHSLGGSKDDIYFGGSWSEYTKTAFGTTLVFTRTIGSDIETVTVAAGTGQNDDRIIFYDGAVSSLDARLHSTATDITSLASWTAFYSPSAGPSISSIVPTQALAKSGDLLSFSVLMSEAVNITGGTPLMTLKINGQDVTATYVSGSGSSTLVFSATAPGVGDGNSISIFALNSNGAAVVSSLTGQAWSTGWVGQTTSALTIDNTKPVFSSGASTNFAENDTAVAYTASATDAHGVHYSLTGADQAMFSIDANSGAVKFLAAPDYEHPSSSTASNDYHINVVATDGAGNSISKAVVINVTNVNERPEFTSGTVVSFAENGTGTAYTAAAVDPEGTAVTFTLSGPDAALFQIVNGVVTFIQSPNFENPLDVGKDNVYDITVTASDGVNHTDQNVHIGVTNVNESPQVAHHQSNDEAQVGQAYFYQVAADAFSDPDAGTNLTYLVTSALPNWLNFNPLTRTFTGTPGIGDLGFLDVTVQASDGLLAITDTFRLTVYNQPVINNINPAQTLVKGGTALSFDITVTEAVIVVGAPTLTLDINGQVVTANYSSGSGTNTLVFTATAPGLGNGNAVSITAVNLGVGGSISGAHGALLTNVSGQSTLALTIDNQAPTFSSGNSASFAENGVGTVYDADAMDLHGVTYTLAGADAAYFNIDNATGVVTFKSAPDFEAPAHPNNVYSIVVTATDVVGNFTNNAVTIQVTNVNEPPTITSVGSVNFVENSLATAYTITATDPDLPTTLVYSLSGADAALFNINSTTGAVTFKQKPDFENPQDVGKDNVYDLIATASDGTGLGSLSASQAIQIKVTNVNEPPSVNIPLPDDEAQYLKNYSFQFDAATFVDPDAGDTLSYSVVSSLPSWLSFNASTRTFSGIPPAGSPNVDITVRATDSGGLFVEDTYTLHLYSQPVINSINPLQTLVKGGATLSFDVVVTEPVTVTGTPFLTLDINGQSVTATYSGGSGTNTLVFTAVAPSGANNGSTVTITAVNFNGGLIHGVDGDLVTTAIGQITHGLIIDNQGPTFTSGVAANFAENAVGTVYDADATDANGVTSYALLGTDLDAALFNIDASSGVVTFKSSPDFENPLDSTASGVYHVTVVATDNAGNTSSRAVAITVTDVAEPPVITSATAANFVENGLGVAYTIKATDQDAGSVVTYSLSGTDAALFNVNPATGAVSFKSAPNYEAPQDANHDNVYSVIAAASDGSHTVTQNVAISVSNVNETPVLAQPLADDEGQAGQPYVYVVPANAFTDPDAGDTLTYSASGMPAWLSFNPTTRSFSASTPVVGTYNITVTATDSGALAASDTYTLVIYNQPVINSITPVESLVNGNSPLSFNIGITEAVNVVLGTNAPTLTLNINGQAVIATYSSGSGTKTLVFTAVAPTAGDGNLVTIAAIDLHDSTISSVAHGGLLTSVVGQNTTDVTVDNTHPALTSADTVNFAENAVIAAYTIAATDAHGLSFSITGVDAGKFNVESVTGSVTFKTAPDFENPTDNGANNVYDINVVATDAAGNSSSKPVTIRVTNVNEAPAITSASSAIFAENGTGTVYTVIATDQDAGTSLTYALTGADAALFHINAVTGAVTFIQPPDYERPQDAGGNNIYDVVVSASDGTNTVTKPVQIQVTNVNEAPVLDLPLQDKVAEVNQPLAFQFAANSFSDPDSDPLSYTASGMPSWLTFNPNTRTFTGTPPTTGTFNVTVSASDGHLTTSDTFTLNVYNVPVISSVVPQQSLVKGGAALSFNVVFTDAVTVDTGDGLVIPTVDLSINGRTVVATYVSGSGTSTLVFNTTSPTSGDGNAVTLTAINLNGATIQDSAFHDMDTTVVGQNTSALTVDNTNPNITSPATASFAENATGTVYDADATDAHGVTFSITGTDAGQFNVDATTGVVTFKSSPNFEVPTDVGGNNIYQINVVATDGAGNVSSQAVAITVTNVNEAPIISSAASASFAENGTSAAYTTVATDVDAGTVLTYSLSGADAALFNISSTGVVTFKSPPNFEAPADATRDNQYDITVTASDGSLNTTKPVTITVTNVNEAPVVLHAIGTDEAQLNKAYSLVVPANTFQDPDLGDILSYSAAGLPAWLQFDSASWTFSGTPPSTGTFNVTVTATDLLGLSVSDTFALTVYNQPVIQSINPLQTLVRGGTDLYFNVGITEAVTVQGGIPELALVINGQTVTALYVSGSGSGTLVFHTVAPSLGDGDVVSIAAIDLKGANVTGSAGSLLTTVVGQTTHALTVDNSGPLFSTGTAASFAENGTGTVYDGDAADPHGPVTYSLSGADNLKFNIDTSTGVVTFKTAPDFEVPTDSGADNIYDINVVAIDGLGNFTPLPVKITVTDVNEVPVISSGSAVNFAENGTGTAYAVVATDQDAGTILRYSLSGTDAGLFNISNAGAVTFKNAPNFEAPGSAAHSNVYSINVIASDGTLSATKPVTITVTNVNEAPDLVHPIVKDEAQLFQSYSFVVPSDTFIDPDFGDTLTYSASGLPSWLTFTPGTHSFSGTPTAAGIYNITVSAKDSGNLTTSDTYVLTVYDHPVINSIVPTQSLVKGNTVLTFHVGVTEVVTVSDSSPTLTLDINGQAVTAQYSSGSGSNDLVFTAVAPTNGNGDSVSIVAIHPGTATIEGSNQQALLTTVVGQTTHALTIDNQAPVFSSATSAALAENATGTVYDADATDLHGVVYGLSGADAGLFQIDTSTGVVTFNSSPDYEAPQDAGHDNQYDIQITATDQANNVAVQSVAISVTNVNETPVLAHPLADATAAVGTAFTYQVAANAFTDPDAGTALNFSATGLPSWLHFDATTHSFSGTPDAQGVSHVTVAVSDGQYSVSDVFDLTAYAPVTVTSGVANVTNLDPTSNIILTTSEAVTAVANHYIHVVNDGGIGFHGEATLNTQDILVTDSTMVSVSGTKITLNLPYDLDLSNDYHIIIDQGAFVGTTSGLGNVAVTDPHAMSFSTVDPSTTLATAAASQKMVTGGANDLTASYSWWDIDHVGNPSTNQAVSADLSAGNIAMVFKNYDSTGPSVTNAYDGVTGSAGGLWVNATNFGIGDLLYYDTQVNTAAAQPDLSLSNVTHGATGATRVLTNAPDGGIPSVVDITTTLGATHTFDHLIGTNSLKDLLGTAYQPIVSG